MSKVTGIKSVDFKITAYGYGVVNLEWDQQILVGDDGKQKIIIHCRNCVVTLI